MKKPKKIKEADIRAALQEINNMTYEGIDFPDAMAKMVEKSGIDSEVLRDAYDEQFAIFATKQYGREKSGK